MKFVSSPVTQMLALATSGVGVWSLTVLRFPGFQEADERSMAALSLVTALFVIQSVGFLSSMRSFAGSWGPALVGAGSLVVFVPIGGSIALFAGMGAAFSSGFARSAAIAVFTLALLAPPLFPLMIADALADGLIRSPYDRQGREMWGIRKWGQAALAFVSGLVTPFWGVGMSLYLFEMDGGPGPTM